VVGRLAATSTLARIAELLSQAGGRQPARTQETLHKFASKKLTGQERVQGWDNREKDAMHWEPGYPPSCSRPEKLLRMAGSKATPEL
jgi:hypothetical protein